MLIVFSLSMFTVSNSADLLHMILTLRLPVIITTEALTFLGQRLRNKQRCALLFGFQRYYVSKNKVAAAMPVYIDKLFKEAPLIVFVGYIPQQPPVKKRKLVDEAVGEARTSKELEKQGDDLCDNRSLVLASLMINEIDAGTRNLSQVSKQKWSVRK
ncbi:hypothetical protein EPI10_025178 [Gossypium australe]|uniref:Uncharacterized protein n=1 Tax=Gossypium australe TaxID=47621 RepID=A0A5B6W0V9_9ROSI|nr:hypothetical protein EPI10_025178 [Gossypium australe]